MLMLTAAVVLVTTGVAAAVSGGGYSPSQQDCPLNADSNAAGTKGQPANPVPDCHNFKLNVGDGTGKRYAEAGLDQLPQGYPSVGGLFSVGTPGSPNFPHSGCAAVNTNGTDAKPTHNQPAPTADGCGVNPSGLGVTVVLDTENTSRNQVIPQTGTPDLEALAASVQSGVIAYLGADDNLDAGEHDGVDGHNLTSHSANGPSDGGAVTAHFTPKSAATTPSPANPVPVAGASEGFCADGFCQEVTTRQQTVYQGNPHHDTSRDVANYQGKAWDPYNCSSGDANSEKACITPKYPGLDGWRNAEAHNVNAEPGAQVYEDPDAQASPIDPLYEAGVTPSPVLYPIPAVYAGTCGVVAGGGPVASAPAGTPSTNSAGQVVVSTGC